MKDCIIGNHFTKNEFFGKGSVPEKTWLLVKEMSMSDFVENGRRAKGVGRRLYYRGVVSLITGKLYDRRSK